MNKFLVIVANSIGGVAHLVYAIADTPDEAAFYAKGLTQTDTVVNIHTIGATGPTPLVDPIPAPVLPVAK